MAFRRIVACAGIILAITVCGLPAQSASPADVVLLKQMLHEYVSFALFSAGAALGSGVETALAKSVGPMLQALHPQG